MNTKKIAALFPGQGSQYVEMAKTLLDNFPWAGSLYEEASDSIKTDLKALCLNGPADQLQLTENQQPCILVTSYAWFQALRKNLDFRPYAGAGHSLGEYSAMLSGGALTLAEAVPLVRARGQLMQKAVPVGAGKMAAIIGLSDDKVVSLCEKASQGEHSVVVPANFNAPSQVVIAGHTDAVERAEQIASGDSDPELKARKVIPLNVSAPFHSPLMTPVAREFFPYLEKIEWKNPDFPVVSNVDSEFRREGPWAKILRDQVDHPVLWTSCAATLETAGSEIFVEMGPSKVLTGLAKRIVKEARLYTLDSMEDFRLFEKAYQEDSHAER